MNPDTSEMSHPTAGSHTTENSNVTSNVIDGAAGTQQSIDESEDNDEALPNNDFSFTEEDFLEAQANMNEATRHIGVYNSTWTKIRELEGKVVECKHADGDVHWKIVESVEDDEFKERKKAEWKMYQDFFLPVSEELCIDDPDDLSKVFWAMWPKKIDSDLASLNEIIQKCNDTNKDTYKRAIKTVSRSEFVTFHALLIGASIFSKQGERLWEESKDRGLVKQVNFGRWMKSWRFRQIKGLICRIMESSELEEAKDDWWKFKQRLLDVNKRRKEILYASYILVFDESMSAYIPR